MHVYVYICMYIHICACLSMTSLTQAWLNYSKTIFVPVLGEPGRQPTASEAEARKFELVQANLIRTIRVCYVFCWGVIWDYYEKGPCCWK